MRISMLVAIFLVTAESVGAQETGYEYQDGSVIQQTVEEVMSRPEFQRLKTEDAAESRSAPWLDWLLDRIAEWFGDGEIRAGRGWSGARGLVYAIAALVVVAALAFIFKSVLEATREGPLPPENAHAKLTHAVAAPGETSPEEFWTRAHALAAEGNQKLAIRELLFGAMSSLERAGRIRYRRGLTNRDYVWAAAGESRTALRTIVDVFERIYFGRRRATSGGFDECAEAFRAGFRRADADTIAEAPTSGTPTT